MRAWGETIHPGTVLMSSFVEQIDKRMNELVVESEGFVNEELDGPITPAEVREQLKLLKN